MLNSIFRKWVAAYLAITFAGIIILTAAISWLVQRDFYRQGLNQLNDLSVSVEQSFDQYRQDNIALSDFRKSLKKIEQDNGVQISVLGKKVKIFRKELLEIGIRPDVRNWVVSVNDGQRIEKISSFRQQDGEKMLIVGFPLKADGEVVAAAFVYSPVNNVDQLAKPIRRSIWLVGFMSAGPLILLLWLATRRLVRPIRQMSKAAVQIADGDFSSRVKVTGSDEVSRLGSSFNRMAERIERIEDQRRNLIMELTHELRTPLTSIRASLQAMSDGIVSGSEQKEYIDLSLTESRRLGNLIDNLQELSAFEEHQIPFEFKRTDLRDLVELSVKQFQHQAEQSGKRVTIEAGPDKPIGIDADPERLRQVMVNLIGNALHHNPEGTHVVVRVQSHSDKAVITVEDDGKGIPPEHLPHLFERFYKAESSRSTKGSGVGLTISRVIVTAHGGTIRVDSEWGEGTHIRIELPLRR